MRAINPLVFASFASFYLMSGSALAGDPETFSLELPVNQIYGGTEVDSCGWPSTVSVGGQCTGTLVHPEVMIYAAHCGSGYSSIRLGEDIDGGPGRSVQTEFCRTYPGGGPGNGADFAFCKLAEPVTDVPIVPILMGCETSVLQPGTEVTIVGFGNADNGPYGIKREVTTTINGIGGNGEAFIGGGGKDSCQGDSGGPVFVKLKNSEFGDPADDTWRVFGITSWGDACGTGGYYSMMHEGIEWFESESGVDLTPCHDAEGNWEPTGECAGFPIDPAVGGGSWADGCDAGPVGGVSQMCGAPAAPDETAPTVSIVDPLDGTEYPGPKEDLVVSIDADDVGWGIKEVQLIVNGEEVEGGVDSSPPYEFEVTMPDGQWVFGAKATDLGGNIAHAEEVAIGVGEPAGTGGETDGSDSGTDGVGTDSDTSDSDTSDSGTSDSGSGTGGTDGSDSGTDGSSDVGTDGSADSGDSASSGDGSDATTGGLDDGESGCGCTASGAGGQGAQLFSVLVLLGLVRRRRS